MLVLELGIDEIAYVGDDIEIRVVRLRHRKNRVQIGITAPADMPVDRKAVREAKLAGPRTPCQRRKSLEG